LATNPGSGDTTLSGIPSRLQPIQVGVQYEIEAMPGETIHVPVTISNPAGMSGFTVVTTFPPSSAGLTFKSVNGGGLTSGFLERFNTGDRYVRASMASAQAVDSAKAAGELLVLDFDVAASAVPGTTYPITVNAVRLAGEFADNFDWYTDVIALSGNILVKEKVTTGALTVSIEPEEARTLGAQWRVDGGEWQNSAATVASLTPGGHLVEFKGIEPEPVRGCFKPKPKSWTTPASQAVTIVAGQTTTASGIYIQEADKALDASMADPGNKANLAIFAVMVVLLTRRRKETIAAPLGLR
ncbi:MAG: hypothetical protein QG656_1500, partial [Candidatus Hydrogenedentes bacterium]|nr:hypothetical protein [Candidatus Hydrogenedentota bacterium]